MEKKCGISERNDNIMERENIRAKIENKSVVRRSERRVRKLVWIRVEKAVWYITTQSEDKIRLEKVDKQRHRSTQKNGR